MLQYFTTLLSLYSQFTDSIVSKAESKFRVIFIGFDEILGEESRQYDCIVSYC